MQIKEDWTRSYTCLSRLTDIHRPYESTADRVFHSLKASKKVRSTVYSHRLVNAPLYEPRVCILFDAGEPVILTHEPWIEDKPTRLGVAIRLLEGTSLGWVPAEISQASEFRDKHEHFAKLASLGRASGGAQWLGAYVSHPICRSWSNNLEALRYTPTTFQVLPKSPWVMIMKIQQGIIWARHPFIIKCLLPNFWSLRSNAELRGLRASYFFYRWTSTTRSSLWQHQLFLLDCRISASTLSSTCQKMLGAVRQERQDKKQTIGLYILSCSCSQVQKPLVDNWGLKSCESMYNYPT